MGIRMITKILMFIAALMPFTGHLEAGFWDKFFTNEVKPQPKTIRVLIVHDKPGVVLEVKGKYAIYDPNKNKHISSRFLGKRRFIQAVSDGIRWGEEFPGIYQLLIVPEEKVMTTVVDGTEYRGSIYVYDVGGNISIVNEIELDDYLNSTLSIQYPGELSEEAAAAIAIAARTNALFFAENPKSPFWSVDANLVGYHGQSAVRLNSPIAQAIAATKQMVMSEPKTNVGNSPFPAEWVLSAGQSKAEVKLAMIPLQEVENLADTGSHAAEILKKAFPGTSIQLTD
jgi:hypothetical protein